MATFEFLNGLSNLDPTVPAPVDMFSYSVSFAQSAFPGKLFLDVIDTQDSLAFTLGDQPEQQFVQLLGDDFASVTGGYTGHATSLIIVPHYDSISYGFPSLYEIFPERGEHRSECDPRRHGDPR